MTTREEAKARNTPEPRTHQISLRLSHEEHTRLTKMNQLARHAHYTGQMNTEEINKALDQIREIFDHVKQWWKY